MIPFILFIFSLTPLLWLRNSAMILGHDSGFRLNFIQHLRNLWYAWYPNTNWGIDWSLYPGFILVQLPEVIASALTGSVIWGQRIALVYWFYLIGLSAYCFARYFFYDKKYSILELVVPVFWMYNFYILNGWAIAERAKFSLYIALPLSTVLFFRTVRKEWSVMKGSILFGLLFFFFNGGGSPPLYGAMLVTLVLLGLYFPLVDLEKYGWRSIAVLAAFGVSFIFFNAYWLIPQIHVFLGSYQGAVSARGGIEGLIAWEREISKYASIPNVLRLQGFPDWYNNIVHPFSGYYLSSPLLIGLSFLPIVTILLGFVYKKKEISEKESEILRFLGIVGVVGLFFTVGSHAPTGPVYIYLMRHIPGFAIFRSSFYKFAPTVYLPIIVFFGYFISLFMHNVKKKYPVLLVGVLISIGVVLYHFPYLTGDFFRLPDGFSTKVHVPSYVTDMGSFIASQTSPNSRILLVPPLDTGFINSPIDTYTWGYYSLDALPRILVNRSFVANDSDDDSITRSLYKSLITGDRLKFLALMQKTGITYVLWRGDVKSSASEEQEGLSSWETALAGVGELEPTYEAGPWKIYALTKTPAVAMVSVYATASVNFGGKDEASILGGGQLDSGEVLLDGSPTDFSSITIRSVFAEAECFYCKEHEYSKFVESVTLPTVSTSRIPFLRDRQLVRIREVIRQTLNTPQEIDARLSLSSYHLAKGETDSYVQEISRIVDIIRGMEGRLKDIYANRVLGFLDAHKRDRSVDELVQSYSRELSSIAWKREGDVFRFGVMIPRDGMYEIWAPDSNAYKGSFRIDGVSRVTGIPFTVSAGYHRLMVEKAPGVKAADFISPVFLRERTDAVSSSVPGISFRMKSNTEIDVTVTDADSPFVLVLGQRFSRAWGISADGVRQDYLHTESNGFGNAWIIPKTGSYKLTMYYIPQRQKYVAVLWTGLAFILSILYILIVLRRT